jgi:dihydroflavonol-4-reductase
LNIVGVQDVAAGHLRAFERGRSGRRYLLGGENLAMRDIFAAVAVAAGRRPPAVAIPWPAAYAAARVTDAALRPLGREAKLLSLDEVRLGRLPMTFDDTLARNELGHTSVAAAQALAAATRAALEAER